MRTRAMTVAGVMSGTSADGVDVAVVRIASEARAGRISKDAARLGRPARPKLELIAHEGFAFSKELRARILAAMNAESISTAELARLNWRLGLAYADAVEKTVERHRLRLDLIGCHGQTLYHQPRPAAYAGRSFACTWQAGEAQAIASRLRVPVVSNFRPADLLAGGQGAPLVPLLDYVLFADAKRSRVLQNLGGIANLTAIPAGGGANSVLAFDTGPGNMVIDWLAQELFGLACDRNGALAARGAVLEPVLAHALKNPYFRLKPPRTAGREQFGRAYAADFLMECRKHSKSGEDALATAAALTAESIACSYAQFVHSRMALSGATAPTSLRKMAYGLKPVPFKAGGAKIIRSSQVDFIVSGGGARNRTLMEMLAARLEPMGCVVMASDKLGIPAEAKEAAAFALLAWMTWHGRPGNMPAATGARKTAVLGQVVHG